MKDQLSEERKERIRLHITTFLSEEVSSISEVSIVTGSSTSTIQRDLNNKKFMDNDQVLLGIYGKNLYGTIKEKLNFCKKRGNQMGGVVSSNCYTTKKDKNGKFAGKVDKKRVCGKYSIAIFQRARKEYESYKVNKNKTYRQVAKEFGVSHSVVEKDMKILNECGYTKKYHR